MLITNLKIKTMEQNDIDNGYIYIKENKIKALGEMSDLSVTDEQTIDAKGATAYPGFIDAHSHLGMWENGLGFEGDDGNEETDPSTPHLRAVDAVNPMDFCFEEAVNAGITTVLTGPGSANPIAGNWCAVKTYGRRIDDMLIKANIGMKFSLGENPKSVYNGKNETPITRMGIAAIIREELLKAQRYMESKKKAKKSGDDMPEYDIKSEALIPLLKGKCKAFFHAHRADDIFTAIRISKEFKLDYVIVHATEGYKIADILKEEDAHVIAGPIICDRSKPELRDASNKNVATLEENGVKVAICTDHPVIPIQYLNISAGVCVKNGLDYEKALKMLTIIPAEICGIDDKVGSIKVGKDADIVIFDKDPLELCAAPKHIIINGELIK